MMPIWKAWKFRLCAALLAGLLSSQAAQAVPVLSITAAPDPAVVGTPLTLDVRIADVTDLYAYQFTLNFNPVVLRALSVTEGPFLGSGGASTFFSGGTLNNTTGSIAFVFDSMIGAEPGVSGNGLLARMNFSVLQAGLSTLAFTDLIFLNSALGDITVQAGPRTLQAVAVVPEPSTLALFGLGLGLAACAAKRRAA